MSRRTSVGGREDWRGGPPRRAARRRDAVADARETALMIAIAEAKRDVTDAWGEAVRALGSIGHVSCDDALALGVGPQVYAAMAARHGKTALEAMTCAEFLELCPALVEYWPVTEDGLAALLDIAAEARAAAGDASPALRPRSPSATPRRPWPRG